MGPPRRNLINLAKETETPPDALEISQQICRIQSTAGQYLYRVERSGKIKEQIDENFLLVELAQRFRNAIWVKRGTFVIVDTTTLADRDNKIQGEIVNVVREEKAWMKMKYWPEDFKSSRRDTENDSEDDDNNVGKLPPTDSESESGDDGKDVEK